MMKYHAPLQAHVTRQVLTVFLVALLTACSRKDPVASSSLITQRGSFPSPSGSYQLVIGTKSRSLVDYKIVNVATKQEFAPEHHFSDAMRWAACWQKGDVLWIYSGDIGSSVWRRDTKGVFTEESLADKPELIRAIPAELWSFMPSSLKIRWERFRRQNGNPDEHARP